MLLSSNYPVQKPQRSPAGVLPAPSNLTVSHGALTGELDAAATPVAGAVIYNWRIAAVAAPTVVVQTAQTTAARNSFTGLTPGVPYKVEVNAVNSAGTSDLSQPVTQIAV